MNPNTAVTMNQSKKCPVSVVIPTYHRAEMLIKTLERILACDPVPAEIIVHVDGNDRQSENAIRQNFDNIKILFSPINIGPGGGRNRLIAIANYEIVASFDDDSYPYDGDYFSRLLEIFNLYPEAAIVAATIHDRDRPVKVDRKQAIWTATFVGCGCAYKKSDFLATDGYLKLPLAYGAEEVDLAIQLYAQGKKILQTDWLRVYHNTYHHHHQDSAINAASIANIALLAYIRYPCFMWGKSLLQVLNRVVYALQKHRYAGILQGIMSIPGKLWLYRHYRKPTSLSTIRQYLHLRKNPVSISWQ